MIQQYGFVADFDNETENLVPQESGEWVTHADHVAKLQRWKDAPSDLVEQMCHAYAGATGDHRAKMTAALSVEQSHPPSGWVSVEPVQEAIVKCYKTYCGESEIVFAEYMCKYLSSAKPKQRVTVEAETEECLPFDIVLKWRKINRK